MTKLRVATGREVCRKLNNYGKDGKILVRGYRMVYTKSELEILLKQFVNLARKKIPVERVILFGSYAYGRPEGYSDIDLAVISPYFRGINGIERIRLLLDFVYVTKMPKLVDVETLGYTPEEYKNPLRYSLLEEIKRKGKVVYEREKI